MKKTKYNVAYYRLLYTPVSCNICGKKCSNKYKLNSHKILHTGLKKKPFSCEFCDKKFPNKFDFEKHKITHTLVRNYECDICKKRFARKDYLKQHKKFHSKEKDHSCHICNKRFFDKKTLRHHLQSKLTHTVGCKICKQRYPDHNALADHISEHGDKPFQCEECNKQFSKRELLLRHKQRHGPRYYCNLCGKRFSRKYELMTHSSCSAKVYNCDICEKKFRSKICMTKHRKKIHFTSSKPIDKTDCPKKPKDKRRYACEICNCTFTRNSSLIRHGRIHTGEKPYSCDICTQTFTQKTMLEKHLKAIHIPSGLSGYSCDICKATFTQKGGLTRHLKKAHEKKQYCYKISNSVLEENEISSEIVRNSTCLSDDCENSSIRIEKVTCREIDNLKVAMPSSSKKRGAKIYINRSEDCGKKIESDNSCKNVIYESVSRSKNVLNISRKRNIKKTSHLRKNKNELELSEEYKISPQYSNNFLERVKTLESPGFSSKDIINLLSPSSSKKCSSNSQNLISSRVVIQNVSCEKRSNQVVELNNVEDKKEVDQNHSNDFKNRSSVNFFSKNKNPESELIIENVSKKEGKKVNSLLESESCSKEILDINLQSYINSNKDFENSATLGSPSESKSKKNSKELLNSRCKLLPCKGATPKTDCDIKNSQIVQSDIEDKKHLQSYVDSNIDLENSEAHDLRNGSKSKFSNSKEFLNSRLKLLPCKVVIPKINCDIKNSQVVQSEKGEDKEHSLKSCSNKSLYLPKKSVFRKSIAELFDLIEN